jgi:hypothetical protein
MAGFAVFTEGFAFVEMPDSSQADQAIKALNGGISTAAR